MTTIARVIWTILFTGISYFSFGYTNHLNSFPDSIDKRSVVQTEQISRPGKHLFILAGQSNMVGLNPDESFIPILYKALGAENVLVVKDAYGGQPIRRWYKKWKPITTQPDTTEIPIGDLYDRLLGLVNQAAYKQRIRTITLVWMQGERDARMSWGKVYGASLSGLIKQFQKDLKESKLRVVIGRLSDFDLENKLYPHWTLVRKMQEEVASSSRFFDWVDTDDLNDGINAHGEEITNDLHYSVAGYQTLGERFAEKALELLYKKRR